MTSIIILSYNTQKMTQLCIESIRRHTRDGAYEIIVIDNASTDDSLEYLRAQKDIRLIENRVNRGFPAGCNQGLHVAKGDELLLLNSDTIVTPRWLENMKRALYSAEDIGAVSCVTNRCSNWQQISVPYETIEEIEVFAERYNVSDPAKWYPWLSLVGFAFLMKREAYAAVGDLDEVFSPGNFEDDDLSIRLRLAGYDLLLCCDTFIHHFGSASFQISQTQEELRKKKEAYNALIDKNREIFYGKWNIDDRYTWQNWLFIAVFANISRSEPLHATIVDCAYGRELCALQALHPNVAFTGIALRPEDMPYISKRIPVRYAASLHQVPSMISEAQDYIVLQTPVEDEKERVEVLEKLAEKLRLGGKLVWLEDGKIRIEALA